MLFPNFAPEFHSILENEELFDLMIQSGCIGILMGFETFSDMSLKEVNKKIYEVYSSVVKKTQP